jgi:hypothetical protein
MALLPFSCGRELLHLFEVGVFDLLPFLMPSRIVAPVLKPIVRVILGLIVIPIFRVFLHRVVKKELNEELEKDISQWLRGSLLLLVATANMESLFFGWVPPTLREEKDWLILAGRLLLAIGVIEAMPDQALFSIIHPGPPALNLRQGSLLKDLCSHFRPTCRGLFNQHLSRSSAVFAILAVIKDGPLGWICYGLAITNYLIIGLMASRDKALDVLSKFDEAVSERRRELELAVLKHDQLTEESPAVTRPSPKPQADAIP